MNDAQSTVAGLKAQDCPGGGWVGMPAELEGRATVADCLAHGGCGCIYGDAVQHIERLEAALKPFAQHAASYDGGDCQGIGDGVIIGWAGKTSITVGDLRRARAAIGVEQRAPEQPAEEDQPRHNPDAFHIDGC